jgi:predicted PurR-regulated permease PerM
MIIVGIYAITLVFKEWKIFEFLLTVLTILSPLFIGVVIAWLFDPIVRYLQKKKVNRILGTSLVYLVFLTIIYLIFNTMIPVLFEQINEFINSLPSILDSIVKWFNNLFSGMQSTDYINFDSIKNDSILLIERTVSDVTTNLPAMLINLVKSVFSAFGIFVLGLMIGFYLLFDFDNTKKVFGNLIPKKYKNDLKALSIDINNSLLGFVKGTLFRSTIIFVTTSVGFAIIGLKAPLLFGLICAITNIIPYIGAYIGAAIAIIVAFSQGTGIGVATSIMLFVIESIDGNFIAPIVMSKTMKLHPVTILIGLLVFNHFFGIVGMILAPPVIAVFKVVYVFLKKKYEIYRKDELVNKDESKI